MFGIAQKVAAAAIPDDYDLFDPAYACVVTPDRVAGNPTPGPSPTPRPGATLVGPSRTGSTGSTPTRTPPTPPAPPSVTIRQPTAGQHIAPNGLAALTFSGLARNADGTLIPGTYYRWTASQANTQTLLCAGSGIGTGAPPTTIGGLTITKDCTSFTRVLANPVRGSGPPITIRLEARDAAGTIGSATVAITLYTPPVG